ncbi:hypothetical protein NL108_012903 [Boleophthalmus pectinirostris]|nr:hypothetical protein NL108_012903 [Boleophthalmus pectinirostris]
MATQTTVEMNDLLELFIPLQHQISITIDQMQSCRQDLEGALCIRRWKFLGFIFLILILVSGVMWGLFGRAAGICSLIVVILYCVYVVVAWCKLPSPAKAVKELDRLATELKYKVNTLTQTLETERNAEWFSSWNSRWKSLDELEKLAKVVMDLVTHLRSETRSDLISQLKEKLQKCQELVKKI